MLRKLLLSVLVFVAATVVALPTHAATTFNWTDLSSQLAARTNRPVWAMAYANGNWFYTDGLDLWNGGQVYRYDGATQTNITVDVRNTGISRVDDIVSDGQSVLFLQNVATKSNILVAVRYSNGTYTNLTSILRSVLHANETFAVITGKNGDWRFVTTEGRLFRWNGSTAPVQISLPSGLQSRINQINANHWTTENYTFGNYVSYTNGMKWPSGTKLLVVPMAGSRWLVTLTGASWETYHMDGDAFSNIASSWNQTTNVQWIASNGETAFIASNVGINYHNDPNSIRLWNGQGMNVLSNVNTTGASFYFEPGTRVLWTGSRWMIIANEKQVYTLTTEGALTYIGEARDFFVTGATNGNGTILLGGAISKLGFSQPTSPLTAKLSKVTEANVTTPSTGSSLSTSNVSAWAWLDPNQGTIRRNQFVTYNVGAWASNGLSRVEIFVNGTPRRTCEFGTAYGNQSCTYAIWGGDYGIGTQVAVNAKATSASGQTVWTNLSYLTVTDVTGSTNSTNNSPATWAWSVPDTTTIVTTDSARFMVGAWDADGLSKIEMYVNGSLWNTCNFGTAFGNRECSITVNGSSFSAGSDVTVSAKATDVYGNASWSTSRTYRIVSPTTSTPSSNQSAAWIWSSPDVSSLTGAQTATFNVGAWDADGLNRTEIWVNGQVKNTCSFGNVVGNRDCTFVIRPADYPTGTSVFVNARIVDSSNDVTWSNSKSYSVTN
jgi:hypothetical protein